MGSVERMFEDDADPYAEPETETEQPLRQLGVLAPLVTMFALLVLIVGVVTVVGDRGDDVDPVELLGSAPDAAREAGSARMEMQMSFGGEGFNMEMGGEGVVDFETGAGTFDMRVLGQSISMRSDGETVWMQLPDLGPGSPITAPWVAIPAEQFQSSAELGGGMDSATGMLDALRGIGGEVTEVGTDEIRGFEVTQYRAVVNLEDAIAAAPEAQREQAEAALQQFGQLGATEMPIDVWITDDGLPIRQVVTWEPKGLPGMPDGFAMEITVDFSDFGTDVVVEPPPADQVQTIDPSELQELFGGGMPTAEPEAA